MPASGTRLFQPKTLPDIIDAPPTFSDQGLDIMESKTHMPPIAELGNLVAVRSSCRGDADWIVIKFKENETVYRSIDYRLIPASTPLAEVNEALALCKKMNYGSVRTAAAIENIKDEWRRDGSWDLETTPGFEMHYHELKTWREAYEAECEARQAAKLDAELQAIEVKLGCQGNRALATYVHDLEDRLKQMKDYTDMLEVRIDENMDRVMSVVDNIPAPRRRFG
jgi:hypothetical protein